MFITKTFSDADITERSLLDAWLNSLSKPGHAVRVVSQIVLPESEFSGPRIVTTVDTWKVPDMRSNVPPRSTIDDIPEEPAIDIGSGE